MGRPAARRGDRGRGRRARRSRGARLRRGWSSSAGWRRGRRGRATGPASEATPAQISSTLATPRAVSRIACTSSGSVSPALASSWASSRSTKWMSSGPSTLGIMITSSLSPISVTSVRRSSSTHGESRLLTRVHNCVSPRSMSFATLTRPARAASLSLAGMPSSRLPSNTSTVGDDVGELGDHLRVLRWEEVDHAARPHRDLADRFGRANGERPEEIPGAAHGTRVGRAYRSCEVHVSWGRAIIEDPPMSDWSRTPNVPMIWKSCRRAARAGSRQRTRTRRTRMTIEHARDGRDREPWG